MEQTAVEWLANEFYEKLEVRGDGALFNDLVNQAKKMEKQQQGYSEEEVKRLAFDFYYDMSYKIGVPTNLISENATNVDVWFEQFKKK